MFIGIGVTTYELVRYYRETGIVTFAANSPPMASRPRLTHNRRSRPQRWLTVLPDSRENSATAAPVDAKLVRDNKAS